jgi:GNAT superfamily N-acetyltransferase
MSLPDIISRLWQYGRRHGLREMVKRVGLELKRLRTGKRMVLFYCDLKAWQPGDAEGAALVTVARMRRQSEVPAGDLLKMVNSCNGGIMLRLMSQRFDRGASCWLARMGNHLAGYGWTLCAGTIEPHFFPLGSQDVHLFDFFVFPEFRGRRVNVALVHHILAGLAAENRGRAFIEAAEWNTPQLCSLRKMPFKRLGCARKFRMLGKTLVLWD